MNNLYGKSMSEYLPYKGFKWVGVNNETTNKVLNTSDDSLYGYLLEVDLECPEELHDKNNNLPMATEKIKVKQEMLPPYQLEIKNKFDIKVVITDKLIPNLIPKKN